MTNVAAQVQPPLPKFNSAGIKATPLGAFLKKKHPPRFALLAPWLRNGESALIWAGPGIGKTWFVLTVALVISGGGAFAGWEAKTPRRVLLVDGEMNEHDLQTRLLSLIGAIKASDPAFDETAALKNLEIIARQGHPKVDRFFDLSAKECQEDLLKRVGSGRGGGKFDLVIFDNLSTLSESLEDENDAAAFRRLMGFLMGLKSNNVASILVHHANKGGDNYRGSSALATTFEVVVGLTRPKTAAPDAASFRIDFQKHRAKRDEATAMPKVLTMNAFHQWDVQVDESSEIVRMYGLAETGQYINQTELAEAMGVNKSTISRWHHAGIAKGIFTKEQWGNCFKRGIESRSTDKQAGDEEF